MPDDFLADPLVLSWMSGVHYHYGDLDLPHEGCSQHSSIVSPGTRLQQGLHVGDVGIWPWSLLILLLFGGESPIFLPLCILLRAKPDAAIGAQDVTFQDRKQESLHSLSINKTMLSLQDLRLELSRIVGSFQHRSPHAGSIFGNKSSAGTFRSVEGTPVAG